MHNLKYLWVYFYDTLYSIVVQKSKYKRAKASLYYRLYGAVWGRKTRGSYCGFVTGDFIISANSNYAFLFHGMKYQLDIPLSNGSNNVAGIYCRKES
jgi:hypothetical protein